MLLRARELFNLAVVTQSGVHLGRLAGFEFEVESQTILRYEVRRSLFGPPFLISRAQVISINVERMVVEDAAVPVRERTRFAVGKPATEEQPTVLGSNLVD